jgi:hypothetical protein
MASFAKIGLNNKVIEVLSVVNEVLHDSNGIEQEAIGIDFLTKLTGYSLWKQTSYNTIGGIHLLGGTPFRKNHAGIGYQYDSQRDAFISTKPFNSWILNEQTCNWESSIPYPITNTQNRFDKLGKPINDSYTWNESTLSWDLLDNS